MGGLIENDLVSLGVEALANGLIAGIIHFVVAGALYKNPLIDRFYVKESRKPITALRKWKSIPTYMLLMFLGTQVEIFIFSLSYSYFHHYHAMIPFWVILLMFAAIRVYPRFFNMWIQSTYHKNLLAIEFVNGLISTFIILGIFYLCYWLIPY